MRVPVLLDFTQPNKMSDVALIVEGQELYVNKSYLSKISPFFKAMFEKRIPLESEDIELKYEQVLDFMKAIHPPWEVNERPHTSTIRASNIDYLLPLARYFEVEYLVFFRVDKFLAQIDKDHKRVSLTKKKALMKRYGSKLPMTKELVFPYLAEYATTSAETRRIYWQTYSYAERHWRKPQEAWLKPRREWLRRREEFL